MKKCATCKKEKSKDCYRLVIFKNGTRKLCRQCDDCDKKAQDYCNSRKLRKPKQTETNKEKYLRYVKNNPKLKEYYKNWRDKNKENKSKYDKERRAKLKEEIKIKKAEWLKKNRDWDNAANAKKRAAKLRATPRWLTKEHEEQIKLIYKESHRLTQETGIKYQVDHIIPLQGKTVSGLHVPWNLEPILAEENCRKRNKLVDDEKLWRKVE